MELQNHHEGGFIQTVLGRIDPGEFGICYAHEHLLGAPPCETEPDVDFVLDDEEAAARELQRFKAAGGSAVVEMSTADYGRDPGGLRRVSKRTGIHILCASGYNKDRFSARFTREMSVGEMTARFTREVRDGIGDTGVRAGLVKAASTLNEISPAAEKVFRAAAATHRRTGAPISTHTEAGTMAIEQLRLLEDEGVEAGRVVVGHMDRKLDVSYHLEVADAGAYLGYDQISKEKYYSDRRRAEVILHLIDEGYAAQILLAGDLARRSYWPSYGFADAAGFAYILNTFIPMLKDVGASAEAVDMLLRENPARAFTFAPAASGAVGPASTPSRSEAD